jgi:shikimate kinase
MSRVGPRPPGGKITRRNGESKAPEGPARSAKRTTRDGKMTETAKIETPQPAFIPSQTIVLVGLMGAGKSCIGKRLAQRLGVPFLDADTEIEKAAGCSIAEIFAKYGEASFRDGERRVMARLLQGEPCVLATGGGAFMDEGTRTLIRERALSVWLRADLDILVSRTRGRGHRPLLNGRDPRESLSQLIDARYPVYAEADVTVDTGNDNPNVTCSRVLAALEPHLHASVAAQ